MDRRKFIAVLTASGASLFVPEWLSVKGRSMIAVPEMKRAVGAIALNGYTVMIGEQAQIVAVDFIDVFRRFEAGENVDDPAGNWWIVRRQEDMPVDLNTPYTALIEGCDFPAPGKPREEDHLVSIGGVSFSGSMTVIGCRFDMEAK